MSKKAIQYLTEKVINELSLECILFILDSMLETK